MPIRGKLEQIEERLFALRVGGAQIQCPGQMRFRHVAAEFEAKLGATGERAKPCWPRQKRNCRAIWRDTATAAAKLSAARIAAAERLEQAVAREFAPLKLGNAQFRVALEPIAEDAGANGLERVGV